MSDSGSKQSKEARVQGAIERSSRSIERSADALDEEADRRTSLAADRTVLAAERTYAAWVRTALTALASGVGARALLGELVPLWLARVTGTVLILFAAFCLCAAVWREFSGVPSHARVRTLPRIVLLPLTFFLLLVTLAALVGVWAK